HQLIDEEEARLEHLLVDQNEPGTLRRGDERDRHRVRRESRPRLILELRHVPAEIALNDLFLLGGHDEIRSFDLARDAEAREAHERRPEMFDAGVRDAQLRSRGGRHADKRTDLDVVRADTMRRAAELSSTFDGQLVRADAVDVGAERDEKVAEVLNVWLAGRVAEDGGAARGNGRGDRVLGGRDAGLIEKDVGAAEAFRGEMEALIELEVGAEALERQKMRVDAAAADDVAARRRQLDLAAAREERRGQKNRRANLSAQLGVEARRLYGFRMNLKRVALRPRDVDAQGGDELDQRLDVANARHV